MTELETSEPHNIQGLTAQEIVWEKDSYQSIPEPTFKSKSLGCKGKFLFSSTISNRFFLLEIATSNFNIFQIYISFHHTGFYRALFQAKVGKATNKQIRKWVTHLFLKWKYTTGEAGINSFLQIFTLEIRLVFSSKMLKFLILIVFSFVAVTYCREKVHKFPPWLQSSESKVCICMF